MSCILRFLQNYPIPDKYQITGDFEDFQRGKGIPSGTITLERQEKTERAKKYAIVTLAIGIICIAGGLTAQLYNIPAVNIIGYTVGGLSLSIGLMTLLFYSVLSKNGPHPPVAMLLASMPGARLVAYGKPKLDELRDWDYPLMASGFVQDFAAEYERIYRICSVVFNTIKAIVKWAINTAIVEPLAIPYFLVKSITTSGEQRKENLYAFAYSILMVGASMASIYLSLYSTLAAETFMGASVTLGLCGTVGFLAAYYKTKNPLCFFGLIISLLKFVESATLLEIATQSHVLLGASIVLGLLLIVGLVKTLRETGDKKLLLAMLLVLLKIAASAAFAISGLHYPELTGIFSIVDSAILTAVAIEVISGLIPQIYTPDGRGSLFKHFMMNKLGKPWLDSNVKFEALIKNQERPDDDPDNAPD